MPLTMRPEAEHTDPRGNDYLVVGETPDGAPSASLRIVRVLQGLLVIVLALLSLAVFWTFGMVLGLF